MSYLLINGTDVSHLVKNMKIGYETLVSDTSGRNANGDTVIDIVNKKIKVYVTFRAMTASEMSSLLGSVQSYMVSVSFRDPRTNGTRTISCYTGTPEPDYYFILGNRIMYREMSLNFIEL